MHVDELLQTLRHLEVELHQPETRCNVGRMSELLHPDFQEIGRSGRKYSRDAVLSEFSSPEEFPRILARDFAVARLDERLALLTYRSTQVSPSGTFDRHTLRTSLWLLTPGGWQMRFHQGTATDEY